MMQPLLKLLALAVALLFLGGAVLTAMSDRAMAATPAPDAGSERLYFPATKAAVMPRPKPRDAGEPVFFPASKSFGGEALPGVKQKLQQQNAPPQQTAP